MNGLVAGNDGHMGLDDAKLNMQTINSLNIIACESVNQQQQKQQTKKKNDGSMLWDVWWQLSSYMGES